MTTGAYPWIGLVHGENDNDDMMDSCESVAVLKSRDQKLEQMGTEVSVQSSRIKHTEEEIEELCRAYAVNGDEVSALWAHILEKDQLLCETRQQLAVCEQKATRLEALLAERNTALVEEEHAFLCPRVCTGPW